MDKGTTTFLNPLLHPIKIGKDAVATLSAATRGIAAILGRRKEMDFEGFKDETLYIVSGERHNALAHHAYHIAVADGVLRAGETLAVGREDLSDTLARRFAALSTGTARRAQREEIARRDVRGALSLADVFGFRDYPVADHAIKTVMAHMQDMRVPVRFTDAAITKGGNINASDRHAASSLTACFGEAGVRGSVLYDSPDGLHARNHHMAAGALALAEETRPRILYHQCGAAHVVGDRITKDFWTNSLSAHLLRAGAHVMAMPLMGGSFTARHIPSDCRFFPGLLSPVAGLPDTGVSYDPRSRRTADLGTKGDEAVYFNDLLSGMGLSAARLTPEDLSARRVEALGLLEGVFREIRGDHSDKKSAPLRAAVAALQG